MSRELTEQDFTQAAQLLGCSVAAIKAVSEVEAPRGGFLPDGRPTILFEGHIFSRYTKGQYDATHPTISYPAWTKRFYKGGAGEYDRLYQAINLNRTAALMSASWGKFQIMGFNFAHCGFTSVDEFVHVMEISEGDHLKAFCLYIKDVFLDDELRDRRWADFARKYNGPDYKKNRYAEKMAAAYKKYGGA
ncbi:MAG: N-acetylmuramidase family protein [Acidobacteriota bacterium]